MEYNAEFFQYQTRPITAPLAIDQTIQYLIKKKEKKDISISNIIILYKAIIIQHHDTSDIYL